MLLHFNNIEGVFVYDDGEKREYRYEAYKEGVNFYLRFTSDLQEIKKHLWEPISSSKMEIKGRTSNPEIINFAAGQFNRILSSDG